MKLGKGNNILWLLLIVMSISGPFLKSTPLKKKMETIATDLRRHLITKLSL